MAFGESMTDRWQPWREQKGCDMYAALSRELLAERDALHAALKELVEARADLYTPKRFDLAWERASALIGQDGA
jgi:hypothetical protein